MEKVILTPRPYQNEILDKARQSNTVVKLSTGSGKTYIAILLMKHYFKETELSLENGGKRIVFLVKNVPLVRQQANAIRKYTYLTDEAVGEYFGDICPGNVWDEKRWKEIFNSHQVIVITNGVFKDVIYHNQFSVSQINLLVIDECHHAVKNDELVKICELIKLASSPPRILGLTACLINGNVKYKSIDSAISDLEKQLNSRVVTSVHCDVEDYRRNSADKKYRYTLTSAEADYKRVFDAMDGVLVSQINQKRLSPEKSSDIIEKTQRALRDARSLLIELGPFCCYSLLKELADELVRGSQLKKEHITNAMNALNEAHRIYDEFLENSSLPKHLISGKVVKLLEILKEHVEEKKESLRAIVFVDQRMHALAVNNVLTDPSFASIYEMTNVLRSNYVTGHGLCSTQIKQVSMEFRHQEAVLNKFRTGEVNILVATRVIEEGMDVQQCNLVVKMDFPPEYRSYVQSRGRARAHGSCYALLFPDDLNCRRELEKKLDYYFYVDDKLSELLAKRELNIDDEKSSRPTSKCLNEPCYRPYGVDGACVLKSSAVSLLYKYVCTLRQDSFVTVTASFQYEQDASGLRKRALVKLPHPCPIRTVQGAWASNEVDAKQIAALEACKRLHAEGELDDDLLPHNHCQAARDIYDSELKAMEKELMDDLPKKGNGKSGTSKRQRWYSRQVVEALSGGKNNPVEAVQENSHNIGLYLYDFEIKPSLRDHFPQIPAYFEREGESGEEKECEVQLSLLSAQPLSDSNEVVACWPLFFRCGNSTVSLRLTNVLLGITLNEIKKLEECHCKLMDLLLESDKPSKPLQYAPQEAAMQFLVVPTVKFQDSVISWNLVRRVLNGGGPLVYDGNSGVHKDDWRGSVVSSQHLPGPKDLYIVGEVLNDLNPNLPIDLKSAKQSFFEYYEVQYNITLTDLKQPLVRAIRVPNVNDAIFRKTEDSSAKKNKKRDALDKIRCFIPELLRSKPAPIWLWLLIRLLPAQLTRLEQLLGASQWYYKVLLELGAPDQVLCTHAANTELVIDNLENEQPQTTTTTTTVKNLENVADKLSIYLQKDDSDCNGNNFPNISQIVAAMTLSHANDFQSLERMEFVGDSFLKYIVSTFLFTSTRFSVQEGQLTILRMRQISNINLFRIGRHFDLPALIFGTAKSIVFEQFVAPRYVVVEPAHVCEQKRGGQWLADKSIADCVEALLGCMLLHGSSMLARRFLWLIGLKLIPDDQFCHSNFMKECPDGFLTNGFPPVEDPTRHFVDSENVENISDINDLTCRLDKLCFGFDQLQKALGYQFSQPAILLQALTHASDSANHLTGCYQRLEFLGDAVLDYLVTLFVHFESGGRLNPGQMTDLRMALTNNGLLAALSVRHRFHVHLRHEVPEMIKLISSFEESQRSEFNSDILDFTPEGTEKVMVKVLGDLFESLVGAVFVDSGFCLYKTWPVVFKLMKEPFEKFCHDVPINKVRMLHERFPGIKFSKSQTLNDGKISMTLTYKDIKLTLTERNNRCAKLALAQQFLRRKECSLTFEPLLGALEKDNATAFI